MQPNTPEWEYFRKSKIGASDAPCIMGVGFKTPYQLWEEKLAIGLSGANNFAMARGTALEPKARASLEQILGMQLTPSIKLHNQRSWMMATLDAMSFDERTIAEIKCPGAADHALAEAGGVPEKYFPQLQHQMEVCEVDYAYYFSYDGEKGVVVKVFRDESYIKKMICEEEKFFECLMSFDPPAFTEKDYVPNVSTEWESLAARYLFLQQFKKEEEEIREKLIRLTGQKNTVGGGLKVAKSVRKGSVDYKKIPELKGLDLDSYRKGPSECWRISAA